VPHLRDGLIVAKVGIERQRDRTPPPANEYPQSAIVKCPVNTAEKGSFMAEIAAPALRKTALNATHRALKAKMVDFGGWDMPVEYSGITAEHTAVRTAVGLFDVSHMGDIQLRGPGSLAAIQQLSMNDASKLAVGQAHYSAMLYPNGTFVDDVVVHKLSDNDYLIVINAGTREKDIQWVRKTIGHMPGVHVNDFSDYYTQLAIQGPRAAETLQTSTSPPSRTTGSPGARSAACTTS
jgi:aminomethyltransferase